jgi:hypothetical protein
MCLLLWLTYDISDFIEVNRIGVDCHVMCTTRDSRVIDFVNQSFRNPNQPGWKGKRGRRIIDKHYDGEQMPD